MAYTPMTPEQFKQAKDAGYSFDEIVAFEKKRKAESEAEPQARETLSPEIPQQSSPFDVIPNPRIEPQNLGGQIMNVPAAALRSLIQGTGYTQGAINPSQVPTFQQKQQEMGPAGLLMNLLTAGGNAGAKMDFMTNPGEILSSAIGYGEGGAAVKTAKTVAKFDNALVQAEKAKGALDTLRTTLGKAKELALQDVKDLPAELDWAGNVSQKVVNAIKNPVYKVEFTPEGGVVNTIGNLDKVKSALTDLVTTKDFVEAGNMEKRQILQFAGKVRDTMVEAANDAGRPELGKSLKNYHEFMDKYNLVNDKLVDKYGNAMANKLKTTFQIQSEPAVKEAWKELSKSSPEIKSIVNSRNNRELLKNLLKAGSAIAALGLGKSAINYATRD